MILVLMNDEYGDDYFAQLLGEVEWHAIHSREKSFTESDVVANVVVTIHLTGRQWPLK